MKQVTKKASRFEKVAGLEGFTNITTLGNFLVESDKISILVGLLFSGAMVHGTSSSRETAFKFESQTSNCGINTLCDGWT